MGTTVPRARPEPGSAGAPGGEGATGATGLTGAQGDTGPTGAAGTVYTSGLGLALSGDTLSVNPGVTQIRVQPLPSGYAIRAMNVDGSAACEQPHDSRLVQSPLGSATGTNSALECYLGEIVLSAIPSFALPGMMHADGRLLPISQYTALFALIGTTYGGNGLNNLALPKLDDVSPRDASYMICVEGIFPSRPERSVAFRLQRGRA